MKHIYIYLYLFTTLFLYSSCISLPAQKQPAAISDEAAIKNRERVESLAQHDRDIKFTEEKRREKNNLRSKQLHHHHGIYPYPVTH